MQKPSNLVGNNAAAPKGQQAAEPAGTRQDMLEGGRSNQKRRPMQALVDAATALANSGRTPTFQQVADEAKVSRATAYRYFPSQAALVHAVVDEALGHRGQALFIVPGNSAPVLQQPVRCQPVSGSVEHDASGAPRTLRAVSVMRAD